MKQGLVALQEAITVLVSATMPTASSTAFLQASERAGAAVKAVIAALPPRMAMKPGQLAQLDNFLQSSTESRYVPQSFTVQGILTDMYKNFAADLETATSDEASANRKFEDLIDAKMTDLKQMQEDKTVREEERASKEEELADNQQIYDD